MLPLGGQSSQLGLRYVKKNGDSRPRLPRMYPGTMTYLRYGLALLDADKRSKLGIQDDQFLADQTKFMNDSGYTIIRQDNTISRILKGVENELRIGTTIFSHPLRAQQGIFVTRFLDVNRIAGSGDLGIDLNVEINVFPTLSDFGTPRR